MFLGTFSPRLDDKGRLFLPARYREQFASGVVVTRGQERSLLLFTREEFGRLTDRLHDLPLTDKAAREYLRMFLSGASDEVPDRQGRITVPPRLRSYAGLSKDCIVIGIGNRMEIWDAEAWNEWESAKEGEFSDTNEEVLRQTSAPSLR